MNLISGTKMLNNVNGVRKVLFIKKLLEDVYVRLVDLIYPTEFVLPVILLNIIIKKIKYAQDVQKPLFMIKKYNNVYVHLINHIYLKVNVLVAINH